MRYPISNALYCLTLAWLLTACSLSEQPVTYVVVTSTPGADTVIAQVMTTAPTLTPMPLPTLTPTPDIAPDVALRSADRALLDGYYEDAVTLYAGALGRADANPDQRAAAAFGTGRAALQAGLFTEAVTAFTALIADYPSDFRVAQAYFLRGDAYSGLTNWAAAIPDYQQYIVLRPGIIDSYAQERIGDAQLALGQLPDALASYTLATQATRSLTPGLALREKLAQVYLSGGDVTAAVAQYDAILAVAENAPYRATIEFAAGQGLLGAGATESGLARMQRIFNEYPATPQALEAMQQLTANGRTLDSWQQGRVYYLNEDYQNAILAFNTYSSSAPLADIPAELYLLLGRAYRAVGNPPAALVAFQTIVTTYPTDALLGEALLEQGRTRFLSGDTPAAITFYQGIARDYSYLVDVSSEALWRAGYLYSTTEQPSSARQIFEELATLYPTTTQAVSGLNIAAAQALALGDIAGAEVLYSQVARLATGVDQAAALLQLGRLALQRNDTTNADLLFTQAISAAPDSYFSARAADLQAGTVPFTAPAGYRFDFDEVQQLAEAEDWLRTTFNSTQPSPLWVLPPALEADARVIRGRELWIFGAYDAAEIEFIEVLDAYETDGIASYQLALFM
ncbi:MAG: tetratricopeptide repeat protein, partial [Armatimonadetes bacterium]|nr:tetratricopeptide repeat protein [Anaerolineae bacterium]